MKIGRSDKRKTNHSFFNDRGLEGLKNGSRDGEAAIVGNSLFSVWGGVITLAASGVGGVGIRRKQRSIYLGEA